METVMKIEVKESVWADWIDGKKEVYVVFNDSMNLSYIMTTNNPEIVTILSMHHCLLLIKREYETIWVNMSEIKTISQMPEGCISEAEAEEL